MQLMVQIMNPIYPWEEYMKKPILMALAATISLGAIATTPVFAAYPEKPVQFIVPFPPGDLEDVLTRMIAEDFQLRRI